MTSYTFQSAFNRGEVSPLLASRVDAEFWKQAAEIVENWQVLMHGGVRRRSGSKFIREVADSTYPSRLFPFLFSNTQSYVLEVSGNQTMRFFSERGILGAPYTVAHPWQVDTVDVLTYTQFNDLAYFAAADNAPQELVRLGDTNWTLGDALFKDGPYLDENETDTTLTPASTGAVVPDMTGLTAPSGTAAATGGAASAWQAFDRDPATAALVAAKAGFISYDLPGTTTKIADGYWLQADAADPTRSPTNWVFEGYNGSSWIVLDVQSSQIGWVAGERRYYPILNATAYQSYRLTWTAVDGGTTTAVAEFTIHEQGDAQTAFNLTASAVTGINGGQGFVASDVGRTIGLYGDDGRWRWARIVAVSSTLVVTIRLYGDALPSTASITRWKLGAFSEESGWPALVTLFDERLAWGRTDDKPVTVWYSSSLDRYLHGFSQPVVATDAVSLTLLSQDMNELTWLAGDEDLVTGSAKQIRSIGPDDITRGFSALNFGQRKGPNNGAARIQPLSIGGTLIYASPGGKKVRELVMGEQNRYVAPEVSILGEHITAKGIKTWAFSENPDPTVFMVLNNGEMAVMLYDREQKAVGLSRYITDGVFEAVAIIPSQVEGFDDVYVVVRRTIGGLEKRYVEVLEHAFDYQEGEVEDAFFVDCGLTYDGTPANLISGLDHLEGRTDVVALADGGVLEGLTVTGGAVTLPYPASKVHLGLPYTSKLRPLRAAGPGQDGVLFGRAVSNAETYVDVLATGSLFVSAYHPTETRPAGYEVNSHFADAVSGEPVELVSGFIPAEIDGSWKDGGQIELTVTAPLPCLIRSLVLSQE